MSCTPGPPSADQPEKDAVPPGPGETVPGKTTGAAEKSGPPSEDLDQFPTLEDNPAAPANPSTGDVSRTQAEIERTVALPESPDAGSEGTAEKTSLVSGTVSISGSSAKPPMSESDAETTNQWSASTQPAKKPRSGSIKSVNPHVRALIEAGLFAPATKLAAKRGAFAVVEGRYELRETLGEGGMGLVFLAYDNVGDCLVALKTLKPNFLNSAKSRARFIDEAKEMNRIPAHACVLVVKDFGSLEKPFYVTEYLVGGSVGGAIRFQGPLSAELARRYATDIATAIAYIHAKRGRLHRDIKPENVLIDDDGSARLADFGLVWQVGEGSTGMRAGTVPYMPPEVVGDQRKNVGYEWDVYSFGATLYEMLTGHAPYSDLLKREIESTGKTRLEILRHLISQVPPTSILNCNKNADKYLARIAEWAMARDARDRYFHVDHILADLDRLGHGKRPMGPQQTEDGEKAGRGYLSRWVIAAAVLVLALAAGGVAVSYFAPGLFRSSDEPSNQEAVQGDKPADTVATNPGVSPPVVDTGPMFEQSRLTSPLNLTFTTLGGVTQYRSAPAEEWAKIEGKRYDYESDMPWKPADNEAITFTARTDRTAYLTILTREESDDLYQLFPNALETENRLVSRQSRMIPRVFSSQEYSYWFRVTPPAETKVIKAIVADRPFRIAGISDADVRDQGFPAVPADFRVEVDGQTYDSFEAAFGDRWQTVDLTIQVVE